LYILIPIISMNYGGDKEELYGDNEGSEVLHEIIPRAGQLVELVA
jgi:hypothetical protein